MCRLKQAVGIALILVASHLAWADPATISPVPSLPATTRGQTVTIQGSNLPSQDVVVYLRTGREKPGDKGYRVDPVVSGDGTSLSFKLPVDQFDTGRYLVYVAVDSTELPVPGELTVLPDDAAKLKVDAIYPSTALRSDDDDGYDFDISGTDLGQAPNDNLLEVVGAGVQRIGTPEECAEYVKTKIFKKPCLHYDTGMETRRLVVKGFQPAGFAEPVQFRVLVNGRPSEVYQVTFSRITPAELRGLATLLSLIIGAIVLALVWKGIGIYTIGDQRYGPAAAFFLDKQTNSYSLSKFQLLAWTAVAVFGYIFAFLCRILMQWDFHFPDIPSGWPTLLGISAGTTVAAVGITVNHGSKGAGPVSPAISDFISSGGLVASDRFQFFVWTLVGCAGFLGLILSHDPSSLKDLPDVPSGFLYLMGISSAGYLGGKVVRAPGPLVAELLVVAAVPGTGQSPARMTIGIKGENLSQQALVSVDGDVLRCDQYAIKPVKLQDRAVDSSFCTEIELTLTDASAYLEGTHTLTLTNKDGQMASSTFPVDSLMIDPNQHFAAGGQPTTVEVTGKNFADGISAQWTDPAGKVGDLTTNDVKKISDTILNLTLTPGSAGQGKLMVISAIKLRAKADVSVS